MNSHNNHLLNYEFKVCTWLTLVSMALITSHALEGKNQNNPNLLGICQITQIF